MTELLSPAGSMESLIAAVQGGADAVYIGGKRFSARSSAENFTMNEIKHAIDFCHLRGVKLYVALNTMYKDEELFSVVDFVYECHNEGADAFIVSDIGLASKIKKQIPLKIHASTQMTAHSLEDVRMLAKTGFDRVILSRELSLAEINYVTSKINIQIECFVHGALCVSYSGQCLMSSMLGGRSGNRGSCAQPCRLVYNLLNEDDEKLSSGYLLSLKDLNAISLLPELINAGVASLKIEGRMKSPEYVYGVTNIYRKYIDLYKSNPSSYKVTKEDKQTLLQLFNRGGFTDGYFNNHSGKIMISVEKPKSWGVLVGQVAGIKGRSCLIICQSELVCGDGIEIWNESANGSCGMYINKNVSKDNGLYNFQMNEDQLSKISIGDPVYRTFDKRLKDSLSASIKKDVAKMPVTAYFKAALGEKIYFKIFSDTVFAEGYGAVTEAAQNAPITKEAAENRLRKMGNTPFKVTDFQIDLEDGLFIGIQSINELRRSVAEEFAHKVVEKDKKDAPSKRFFLVEEKRSSSVKKMTVMVSTAEQYIEAVNNDYVKRIYVEYSIAKKIENEFEKANVEIFIAMPRISHETENLETDFKHIKGYLIRTYGQYSALQNSGKKLAIDINMNIANSSSLGFWQKMGCDTALSVELTLDEINNLFADSDKTELLIYGRVPLMVTRQCPIGNFYSDRESGKKCNCKNNKFYLQDRMDMKFMLDSHCDDCYSIIYNSLPMFLPHQTEEVLRADVSLLRLAFIDESAEITNALINGYGSAVYGDNKYQMPDVLHYTKGHLYRGVR